MFQIEQLQQAVIAADARPGAIQQADIDALMREVARLRLQNAALEESQRAIEGRQAAEREQMLAAQAETNRRAQEVAQRNAILEQENNRVAEAELARQRALLPPPPPRYPAPVFPAEWQEGMFSGILRINECQDIEKYVRHKNGSELTDDIGLIQDFDQLIDFYDKKLIDHSHQDYYLVYLIEAHKRGLYALPLDPTQDSCYKTFN